MKKSVLQQFIPLKPFELDPKPEQFSYWCPPVDPLFEAARAFHLIAEKAEDSGDECDIATITQLVCGVVRHFERIAEKYPKPVSEALSSEQAMPCMWSIHPKLQGVYSKRHKKLKVATNVIPYIDEYVRWDLNDKATRLALNLLRYMDDVRSKHKAMMRVNEIMKKNHPSFALKKSDLKKFPEWYFDLVELDNFHDGNCDKYAALAKRIFDYYFPDFHLNTDLVVSVIKELKPKRKSRGYIRSDFFNAIKKRFQLFSKERS